GPARGLSLAPRRPATVRSSGSSERRGRRRRPRPRGAAASSRAVTVAVDLSCRAEVSGHLVGSTAFKAAGTGGPRPAGSIPVHLRRSTWAFATEKAAVVTSWSQSAENITGEKRVSAPRRVLVIAGKHVRVHLQRDTDVGVTKALRDHLHRHSG